MHTVITLLIPFLSLVAVNLTASPVGKWDVVAETAYGETYRLALTLTESDGKLGGTLTTPDGGTVQLQNVSLEGSNLTFEVSLGGSLYTVESKIENDEITGTWKGGGDSGTAVAKRID